MSLGFDFLKLGYKKFAGQKIHTVPKYDLLLPTMAKGPRGTTMKLKKH